MSKIHITGKIKIQVHYDRDDLLIKATRQAHVDKDQWVQLTFPEEWTRYQELGYVFETHRPTRNKLSQGIPYTFFGTIKQFISVVEYLVFKFTEAPDLPHLEWNLIEDLKTGESIELTSEF